MKCVNCGAMIPESADKCGVCLCPNMTKRGIELLLKCFTNTQVDLITGIICRYCGKMIRSKFKFCIFCGESQKKKNSVWDTRNDLYLKQLYYDNADEYKAPMIILALKEKYTLGFYRYMLGELAKVASAFGVTVDSRGTIFNINHAQQKK